MTLTQHSPVRWETTKDSVIVGYTFGDRRFRCVVSMEYLTRPYARLLTGDEAIRLFEERRSEIEAVLEEAAEQAGDNANEIVCTTTGIVVKKAER